MLISVAELIKYDNNQQDLVLDLDLSAVSFKPTSVRFSKPVKVEGKLKYAGGVVMLEAVAKGEYEADCDRCGETVQGNISVEISENYVRETETQSSDEDAVVLQGLSLDITQTVSEFIFGNLPGKHLCAEDCNGLCSVCGKNLNHESCTCKDDEWDPRFEALRGLFD